MASDCESASIMAPGFEEAVKINARSRATSESTEGGFAPSVFSDTGSFATANTSPSHYSEEDDAELVEIDKKTFEANTGADMEVIGKETFEANIHKTQLGALKPGAVKVINGSTLGGHDPLHGMVQASFFEPKWWIEEREREDRRSKKRKHSFTKSSTSMYLPTYFDTLPYSPQDYFSSGLDLECDPEPTGEEFWGKVGEAFKLSCRYETVQERREQFKEDFFDDSGPPTPTINDELFVM